MSADPIRMVDLAGRHAAVGAAVEAGVIEVLRSGAYVGGPMVDRVEAATARWFGRGGAVGVGSGTDALILALQAVGVRPGDEVVVPALTFFATAGAVARCGARVVVADVLDDACIDPASVARCLSANTRAVVPVHLFGNTAHTDGFDVVVVDDAAQAIGSDPPCSTGALTVLSTYPTKTWGSAGDGGFVIGDDPALLARVRALANHGLDGVPHLHHAIDGLVGRNSRLDAIQAAVLLGHEPEIRRRVATRRSLAARYDAGLPRGVAALPRSPGCPVHHYVVLVAHRDAVQHRLREEGIHTAVYYPHTIQDQPALSIRANTPNADRLAASMLALPVHAGLTEGNVDRVLGALERAVAP